MGELAVVNLNDNCYLVCSFPQHFMSFRLSREGVGMGTTLQAARRGLDGDNSLGSQEGVAMAEASCVLSAPQLAVLASASIQEGGTFVCLAGRFCILG